MKGDFTRFTFDPDKGYTGVHMQQGRVQLDADWNEQVDILLYQLRTRFQDLVGTRAEAGNDGTRSQSGAGFQIGVEPEDETAGESDYGWRFPAIHIGPGRYYVDGILCENRQAIPFAGQPTYPGATLPDEPDPEAGYLFYLDVWEQHVTADEDPDLWEPALDGLDTATRTRTVWQVKWLPYPAGAAQASEPLPPAWQDHVARANDRPRLSARWQPSSLGLDNQLYRVEIHSVGDGQATFKWSRENGSVVFPIAGLEASQDPSGQKQWIVQIAGRQDPALLGRGDWVEIVDDTTALGGSPRPLCEVAEPPAPAGQTIQVTLSVPGSLDDDALQALVTAGLKERHVLLRRWDHRETVAGTAAAGDETLTGALAHGALVEVKSGAWLPLERGIEVRFEAGGQYRAGDYWLIPARARGEKPLLWPQDAAGQPLARPPQGIDHHLSPLALVEHRAGEWQVHDLRLEFDTLAHLVTENRQGQQHLARLDREIEALRERVAREMARLLDMADRTGMWQNYDTFEDVSPGDVVALEPDSGHIVPANHHNASLVVGVVIAVQELEEGRRCQVAQYGRASCKVRGPITPGDVLVPGRVDGVAVRAGLYATPGTMVGKALAAIRGDDETETVEIMVTLR